MSCFQPLVCGFQFIRKSICSKMWILHHVLKMRSSENNRVSFKSGRAAKIDGILPDRLDRRRRQLCCMSPLLQRPLHQAQVTHHCRLSDQLFFYIIYLSHQHCCDGLFSYVVLDKHLVAMLESSIAKSIGHSPTIWSKFSMAAAAAVWYQVCRMTRITKDHLGRRFCNIKQI